MTFSTDISLPIRRRYLVDFDPKRVPHAFTDVLIIGGGIAGMRAALEVDPKLETIVVTKGSLEQSNSSWAQGGIAGVLDPLDEVAKHVQDTITAGAGLCDERVVKNCLDEAAELIHELVDYGVEFDKKNGKLALTREGGHSMSRIVHALGDATGRELMRALIETAKARANVQLWQQTFTIDLLTHNGECAGALMWNPYHGRTFVWAKQTILATGGAGQLYRETTNPAIATGDGHAMAFRAGVELRDMEMMQFHPTVLYIAGGSRSLISEAVRGEGAYLVNSKKERFMADYDDRLELAPRDIVSRAITDQMLKTQHPCVYLDLRHLDQTMVSNRFPNIAEACSKFGLNILEDKIPVRPGAHYMIGGVTLDSQGRTSLPGLWAAGEATSTGLHGANRLASNSLLEGMYYGRLVGKNVSEQALNIPDTFSARPIKVPDADTNPTAEEELNLVDLRNSLSSLLWLKAGIVRDDEGLSNAIEQIKFWDKYVSRQTFSSVSGWEFQNLLLVSRLLVNSAEARKESRGVHCRSDYPETDDDPGKHITIRRESN